MFIYGAYGLCIHSNIAFPELIPYEAVLERRSKKPDVTISIRQISDEETTFTNNSKQFLGNISEFSIDKFLVLEGAQIIVEAPPELSKDILRLIVLGPILSLLLRQRGLLVLHASGVVTPKGVLAFTGNSGWGKSTLANALYNRGYSLLTDDVMAIEIQTGTPIAFPAYPNVKLMPDAASALGVDYNALTPLSSKVLKRHNCINRSFSQEPIPIKKIYTLEKEAHSCNEIEHLAPQMALLELIGHTRGTNVLTSAEYRAAHLRQCTALIESIPISRLKRRRSLEDLPELIQLIESDTGLESYTRQSCEAQTSLCY